MSRRVKLVTSADLPLLSAMLGTALVVVSLSFNMPTMLAIGGLFLLPAVAIVVRASFKNKKEHHHAR